MVLHRGEDLDDVLDRKAAGGRVEVVVEGQSDGGEPAQPVPPPPRRKAAGTGQKPIGSEGTGPEEKREKPLSRAARRRKIKEEIRKLAAGDKPVYYQRRLY